MSEQPSEPPSQQPAAPVRSIPATASRAQRPQRRTALLAVALLVVLAAVAAVLIGVSGGGKHKAPVAVPTPGRSASPSPTPSPSPSDDPQTFPYVVLHTGDCFDAPGLTTTLKRLVKLDCTQPHDGEVTGREQLPAGLADNLAIQRASLPLCKRTNDAAYFAQGHNSPLHEGAYFPEAALYKGGRHTVTCVLETGFHAARLTAPLTPTAGSTSGAPVK
jgi:hypothetical protein